jgi:hypothetical protein
MYDWPLLRVVLICNVGQHWVLLVWTPGRALRVVDPMASSHVSQRILYLAASLASAVPALAQALRVPIESVRATLIRMGTVMRVD